MGTLSTWDIVWIVIGLITIPFTWKGIYVTIQDWKKRKGYK